MTVAILESTAQIREARTEMKRGGIDCASSTAERVLRKLGLLRGVNIGDRFKSWDILQTVRFIQENVPIETPILDIGAHEGEMLPILHRLGYTDLTGVDLNPGIRAMPHADAIRYIPTDFMAVPCEDGSFGCVTAISVIEHGFEAQRLLAEMSRIIRPGGFFVASVDYWPDKIDTAGIEAYGMDWRIFSREELLSFLERGKEFGLHPVGTLDFEAGNRVVTWMGRRYTFAWMALRRSS